jgi:two-component system chemotaxis sensor kinase CheA
VTLLPPYVDVEILTDFTENLGGTLDEIQHLLLSLDRDFSQDRLAELRRLLHTVKSDAGLLGQKDIERLCHLAEDLLRIEGVALPLEPLFLTWDWLKRRLDWVLHNQESPESSDSILGVLREAIRSSELLVESGASSPQLPSEESTGGSLPSRHDEDYDNLFMETRTVPILPEILVSTVSLREHASLLDDFLVEGLEILDNLDVLLLRLEKADATEEDLNAVFRAFHTIKGLSGFFRYRGSKGAVPSLRVHTGPVPGEKDTTGEPVVGSPV